MNKQELKDPFKVLDEASALAEAKRISQLNETDSELTKSPETKMYLVLITLADRTNSFELIEGRTATFEYCRDMIKGEEVLDLDQCYVLVETEKMENILNLREFMKYMENFFEDFDIDDYYE